MKKIPNIISVLRISFSLGMLLLKPFSLLFWIVYSICGISDMFDGYIARKTNSVSKIGAILDSIADIEFIACVSIILIPVIVIPSMVLVWIILIALIRIISLLIGYYKYHVFASLHTYANKITGLLLFCFIYLIRYTDMNILTYVICTVASVSAFEEFLIQINSKKLDRDIKSIIINK